MVCVCPPYHGVIHGSNPMLLDGAVGNQLTGLWAMRLFPVFLAEIEPIYPFNYFYSASS